MDPIRDQDEHPESRVQDVVPESGPRIEGHHSANGSLQVHEGPHKTHGHVMHKIRLT